MNSSKKHVNPKSVTDRQQKNVKEKKEIAKEIAELELRLAELRRKEVEKPGEHRFSAEKDPFFSSIGLRKILEALPVATSISDAATGKVLYANRSMGNLMGCPVAGLVGLRAEDILADETERRTLLSLLRRNGRIEAFETRCKTIGGEIRWVQISVALSEFEGVPAHLTAVVDITRRKQAENSLREAQDFAGLGRWELDLLSNRLDWSDTIFKLFEIDREKFAASYHAFLEAIHPEDRDRVDEAYIGSLEARTPYEIEHRLLMSDGRIKWVVERCRTEYNEAGQAVRSVGIVQDVTRRREMYNQLQVAYGKVRDLESALNEHSIVALTDSKGTITFANEMFCRISGYTQKELVGQDHRILNSGFHARDFFRGMWQTIQGGQVWRGEIRNRAKDGHCYWVDTTIVPFFGTGKRPYQYMAIRVDITARKAAEEALKRSEAHFRSVTEDLPAYIAVALSDGTLTYVNEALAMLTGKKPRELIGHNTAEFLSTKGALALRSKLKTLTPEKSTFVHEQKVIIPGGYEVWQLWTYRAFFNDEGKLLNYQGFGQDITLQKLAERQLRDAQRKLRTTLNAIVDAVVEIDGRGEIIFANPGAERVLGISRDQNTGKYSASGNWRHVDENGDTLSAAQLPLAIVLRERRELGPLEYRLASATGEHKWVSVNAAPLLDSDGVLYGAVGSFRDITERRQNEIIARERESYKMLFEQAAVGVLLVDSDKLQILRANCRFADMLGYTAQDLVAKDLMEITHPADKRLHVDRHKAMMAGKIREFTFEKRFVRRDGAIIWCEVTVARVSEEGVRPRRHISVIQDITERKLAEEKQEMMRKQFERELIEIQESDRAEFARELHDSVGQNLIILKFTLQPLAKKIDAGGLIVLDRAMAMISEIIGNNRNISRQISPVHVEKLGIKTAIEDLIEKINVDRRYDIRADIAAIENFFPGDWNIHAYRIVQECLTNIMKHSRAKRINIVASLNDGNLVVSVQNDGSYAESRETEPGIGRRIMTERAKFIGASLSVLKQNGSYEVKIAIPPPKQQV